MTFLATAINSELSVGIKSFDLFYIKFNSEDEYRFAFPKIMYSRNFPFFS